MAQHNEFGQAGEQLAANYLEQRGYHILDRNWKAPRSRHELDIVAEHDGWLVVVEVKSRRSRDFGQPMEAVDWRKERSIANATNSYVQLKKIDLPIRFDIIEVVGQGSDLEIQHIERAFLPPVN